MTNRNSKTDHQADSVTDCVPEESGESAQTDGGTAAPFRTTAEFDETRRDRYEKLFHRYVRAPVSILRKDPRATIGFGLMGLYILMGIIAVFILEPTQPFDGEPYVQPFQTWEHPLGTNKLGQDLMYQAFYSIVPLGKMMISGALFTVVLGTVVGVVSGYKGGLVDRILTTVTDVFINLPGIPLVIVLAILFSPKDEFVIGILLSVASWAGLARSLRSQVLTLREEAFVEASRVMDIPLHRVLYDEILPHLMPYIAVNTAGAARRVIFSAVGLYFLGILPFTGANWGTMLSQSYSADSFFAPSRIHWLLISLIFIIGISVSLILLAQSLDRVFNPRVRARHAERADLGDEDEQVEREITRI
jgi:peptide/nickel transport system permease protein